MKKEQEIRYMLKLLDGKLLSRGDGIREREDGVYYIDGFISFVPSQESEKRENYSFTVDFNQRKITMYGYDISYHNGDHYRCIERELPWEQLETAYDSLRSHAEIIAHDLIEKEEFDHQKKVVSDRLDQILKGM